MEHRDKDENRWVDERLASLDPGKWQPDSSAALARLRRRDGAGKPPRRHWWLWATVSATAAAAVIGVLLLSAPSACANPLGCKQPTPAAAPAPAPAEPAAPAVAAAPAPTPAPVAPAASVRPPATPHKRNYKESGSPTAPITCELYTDYECPHCAAFFLETLPQLDAAYVQTGKVRMIHRDFPLPQHQYARLASLYANAAGQLGYYHQVATQLFRTQGVWSGDGNIELQVAPVLPPAILTKVRDLVKNDPAIADGVTADVNMAMAEHINQTPSLVITSKSGQQVLPGNNAFSLLKSYLDELLSRQ